MYSRRGCRKHLVPSRLREDRYAYTEEHGEAQQHDDFERITLRNKQEQHTGCHKQCDCEEADDDANQQVDPGFGIVLDVGIGRFAPLVCRGEEQPRELARDLGEHVFDEAVEPASFLWLAEGDEVFLRIDELAFLLGQGLFVMDPIRKRAVVAGSGTLERGQAFAPH